MGLGFSSHLEDLGLPHSFASQMKRREGLVEGHGPSCCWQHPIPILLAIHSSPCQAGSSVLQAPSGEAGQVPPLLQTVQVTQVWESATGLVQKPL